MMYDGTQDPEEHLMAFEARMNLDGVGDEVRCRAFPVTLAGPTIRGFNSVPQGSVAKFSDISRAFLAQFTTHIAKAKHLINLLGVTQRSGEPTRKYLDRFNDKCLEIDGLTDSVASSCLTNGLLNEDFRKHLTTKSVWTMQEIQSVAREYINDEEVNQVVAANKRQPAYNQPRQHGSGERLKEHTRDSGPTKIFKPFPRVGKFTNYIPLTVPIVEVYQQVAEKGILSKPRPLKDRTGGNKNLYCNYHKGYGHKTQDYFDLKDALEQAIRDGKLAEFSHLIKEPRRRDCDHEGEDKSRAVKRRQDPEDNKRDLTIVNVVIGRDAAPRSRSAHKKDAKVLAISSSPTRGSKRVPSISFSLEDQWFDEVVENPHGNHGQSRNRPDQADPHRHRHRLKYHVSQCVRRFVSPGCRFKDSPTRCSRVGRPLYQARRDNLPTGLRRTRTGEKVGNGGVRGSARLHGIQRHPRKKDYQ
ncbi:uncharacterized protein LOC130933892 [Arachis stenosperma]|uniref:uncharacterized protein LOC130933892 n=1 Tax=Arachis stenosperma TaxID=217475 RepID=UPI0025AC8C73|nr:uncharacterized protein LOC130933892 [Arachis stenosperma]